MMPQDALPSCVLNEHWLVVRELSLATAVIQTWLKHNEMRLFEFTIIMLGAIQNGNFLFVLYIRISYLF